MLKTLLFLTYLTILVPCAGCAASPPSESTISTSITNSILTPLVEKLSPPDDISNVLRVTLLDGTLCSGTISSRKAVLSAEHCFKDTAVGSSMMINGVVVLIKKYIKDGNDHVFVLTNAVFRNYAMFGKPAEQNDNIHYWGNPLFVMLLRRGYVTGVDGTDTLYDVNGWQGDSGAGVFNDRKEVIGVINYIETLDHVKFKIMASYPMNFTAEQLDEAGVEVTSDNKEVLMSGIKADTSKAVDEIADGDDEDAEEVPVTPTKH
jgi:hypothetical protein